MHKENYNTKAVVETGLISSLIVIIMLMTIYIPLFSMLGVFILPIPVTVLYIRHNYKVTVGGVVTSAILIAMLYSPISAFTSSVMFGFTGITLGYCIKKNKKVLTTLLFLAVASAAAMIIDFSVYVTFINHGGIIAFINHQIQMMKDSMIAANEIYSKMGVPQAQLAQLNAQFNILTPEFIIQLMPAVLLFMAFSSAYINYSMTRVILRKLKYEIEPIAPFTSLYINNRIGTSVLILIIVGMLLDRSNISSGKFILVSFEIVLQMILLIDGVAVAAYYLKNTLKFRNVFAVLIIIFTVSSPSISIVYVCTGLMDMIFDFRKLDPFRRKKAQ